MDALGDEAAAVDYPALQYPLILDLSDGARGTFTPAPGPTLPSMYIPRRNTAHDATLLDNGTEPTTDLELELEARRLQQTALGGVAGAAGAAGPSNAPLTGGDASAAAGGRRAVSGTNNDGAIGEGANAGAPLRNDGDERGGQRGGNGQRRAVKCGANGPRSKRGLVQRSVVQTLKATAHPLYTISVLSEEHDATRDLELEDELADEERERRESERDAETLRRARECFDSKEADDHRLALGYDDETPSICQWCLQFITDPTQLQKDHIVARSKGGVTVPENLCLMHANCNKHAKGTQPLLLSPFNRTVVLAGSLFHKYSLPRPELEAAEEGSAMRGRPSPVELQFGPADLELIDAFAVLQRHTTRMAQQDEDARRKSATQPNKVRKQRAGSRRKAAQSGNAGAQNARVGHDEEQEEDDEDEEGGESPTLGDMWRRAANGAGPSNYGGASSAGIDSNKTPPPAPRDLMGSKTPAPASGAPGSNAGDAARAMQPLGGKGSTRGAVAPAMQPSGGKGSTASALASANMQPPGGKGGNPAAPASTMPPPPPPGLF